MRDDEDGFEMEERRPPVYESYPVESLLVKHNWIVPDSMKDGDSAGTPFSSRVARDNLIKRLLSDKDGYREYLGDIGRENPQLLFGLDHLTKNTVDVRRERRMASSMPSGAECASSELAPQMQADIDAKQRHDLRLEFLMSTMLRVRHKDVPGFANVCLSLRCLKCGLPREIWRILCELRVIFSHDWTYALALEIGGILSRWPDDASKSIGFAVGDNCAYMIRLTFEHLEHDGEFLQTINWLSYPIVPPSGQSAPELPGECARGSHARGAVRFAQNCLCPTAKRRFGARARAQPALVGSAPTAKGLPSCGPSTRRMRTRSST